MVRLLIDPTSLFHPKNCFVHRSEHNGCSLEHFLVPRFRVPEVVLLLANFQTTISFLSQRFQFRQLCHGDFYYSQPTLNTHHSISGGGFPCPLQQNVTLWPGIRTLLSGWNVTDGGTTFKYKLHTVDFANLMGLIFNINHHSCKLLIIRNYHVYAYE